MQKKQHVLRKKVLFNASVVLSGINSPKGGSSKVLGLAKKKKITGFISEIILDEVLRHAKKIDLTKKEILKYCLDTFSEVSPAPDGNTVKRYQKIVVDEGDAHVLASCENEKASYLLTLDKKHLLVLKGKIKGLKILTPGEFIEESEK
mgnify:CR=1 FL=1